MMRKIGYNLQRENDLNFEKGRRDFLRNFVPRGKPANYYDNTHRGLGYVTPPPPITVQSKDNKPIPSRSASSSEWDSDVSVGTMFENLTVNIVGPKAYHSSFDDDQLMKLCLLMILCLISDIFIIKILVGA